MRALLDDAFAPITSDLGFLEAPIERAKDGLLGWIRQNGLDATDTDLAGSLAELLPHLEPLTTGAPDRELLVTTRGGWTAYFANGASGGDPTSAVGYLARRLACRGATARAQPHTVDLFKGRCGRYGLVQFQLFGPRETDFLNYVRTVDLTHDGRRWNFGVSGTPQPFEVPARYRARRATDRFTSEMLEAYCRALGLDIFAPAFYGPQAVLVVRAPIRAVVTPASRVLELGGARVRITETPIEVERLGLAEVQRRHCIGPAAEAVARRADKVAS